MIMRNLLLGGAACMMSVSALAQDANLDGRVGKLEKEMRAVQRKVFPQGAPVEPEIGGAASGAPEGSPALGLVSDLTARVDALEAQVKSLTGQVEQQGFRLKRLEDAMKASEARIKALEPSADEAVAAAAPAPIAVAPAAPKPAAPKPVAAAAPAAAKPATAARPAAGSCVFLVDSVPVPVTTDPVEDSYTYGFRLWSAKHYPQARCKLKGFLAENPKHRRASYARNLIGRSFFDERLYNAAAKSFLENYQTDAKGERAAESLSWLGLALQRLTPPQTANACKVYGEFDAVYGATASAEVKARVAQGRASAKCPS